MATEVLPPQWGMGMTEGTVKTWIKQVGDHVEEGEPIAEVETAKAVAEVEAPVSGVFSEIRVNPEETMPVRTVLTSISD